MALQPVFAIYTRPIEQEKWFYLSSYFYGGYTRGYLSFEVSEAPIALARLNNRLRHIRDCLAAYFLKLNDDNNELILIGNNTCL